MGQGWQSVSVGKERLSSRFSGGSVIQVRSGGLGVGSSADKRDRLQKIAEEPKC